MLSISTKYALKCLFRHPRRTFLSVLGVAIGCASCLISISFVRGEGELFMRSVAETGTGHLRIAPKGWDRLRENNLRVDNWRAELDAVRAMKGVRVATPRARANGLLAAGTRTVGVEVGGVDPRTEPESNRLVRGKPEGRYLETQDAGSVEIAAFVGKAVAERLDVEIDDSVVLTVSDAEGVMQQAMLRLVGLVSTGSDEIDATICQVPLADLERLTGRSGAGEIVVLLRNHKLVERFAAKLRGSPSRAGRGGPAGSTTLSGRRGNEVLTWYQISPEMADAVTIDETFTWLTVGIVVFLVFLGITSAQLTAVLQRRREFAVLSALGMKGGQLVRVMFLEGFVIGLAGTALGLLLTLPVVYLLATKGVDLAAVSGEGMQVMSGVLIEPILYGDMGWWLVPYGIVISFLSTLLASIYPAWFAVKTDPAAALRAV